MLEETLRRLLYGVGATYPRSFACRRGNARRSGIETRGTGPGAVGAFLRYPDPPTVSMVGGQAGFGPAVPVRGFRSWLARHSECKQSGECSCMSQRRTDEPSGRVEVIRGWLTGHEHHDVTGVDRQRMPGWFIRPVR